jgi:hypothetical protein
MTRLFFMAACLILAAGLFTVAPAAAQSDDSDLVRLPSQGLVKETPQRPGTLAGENVPAPRPDAPKRLVASGGLLMSFDTDSDGVITVAEREAGILAAFESADADKNGALTAFEQQAWAESLPTHDDSLANPVRFDPNLDRRVSFEEFRAVIRSVAEDYASTGDGSVLVSDLEEEPDRGIFGQGGPGGPGGPPPGENAPTERDRS